MDLSKHDPQITRVLVMGGTGNYGREIVRHLSRLPVTTRVLTRNPEHARQQLPDEVEIFSGDILDPASLYAGLEDVQSVVVAISAFTPGLIRQLYAIEHDAMLRLFAILTENKIARLVYLSVYDIRLDVLRELGIKMEVARVKHAVEKALGATGLNWTIFGAPPSFDLFLRTWRGKLLIAPGGGPPAMPSVSKRDVGAILSQAALRTDLQGKRIRVPGPQAMSFPLAAEIFAGITGEPIAVRKIPLAGMKVGAFFTRPFFPYLHHLVDSVCLMRHFPQDLVADIERDHQWLLDHFQYTPCSLEEEARQARADQREP